MDTDPRAALDAFLAAIERHFEAAARRRGDDDPLVESAYTQVADAFETYEDALFGAYDEVLPFELYDDVEDARDDADDDSDDDFDDEGSGLDDLAAGPGGDFDDDEDDESDDDADQDDESDEDDDTDDEDLADVDDIDPGDLDAEDHDGVDDATATTSH